MELDDESDRQRLTLTAADATQAEAEEARAARGAQVVLRLPDRERHVLQHVLRQHEAQRLGRRARERAGYGA